MLPIGSPGLMHEAPVVRGRPRDLRQVLPIAGMEVAIGILLGVGATILLRSRFYQVGAVEWSVLIPVSAAMLAVSLGVAYFSAMPWINADPMEAVRHN